MPRAGALRWTESKAPADIDFLSDKDETIKIVTCREGESEAGGDVAEETWLVDPDAPSQRAVSSSDRSDRPRPPLTLGKGQGFEL
eukprot:s958_g17.t1